MSESGHTNSQNLTHVWTRKQPKHHTCVDTETAKTLHMCGHTNSQNLAHDSLQHAGIHCTSALYKDCRHTRYECAIQGQQPFFVLQPTDEC